ncbi:MAG: MSCRAMM family protein, partial [Solirubrobacteraceae bacterium]
GLAGFTFYIDQDANGYDASDPQAVSAADGSWTIDGLKPGSYTVKELAKEGWTCSDPGNPCQRDITLTSGQAATGVLFANWHAGSISGSKYEDVNANGARDPGDPALSGLTFYVDQGDPGYQDSDPHAVSAADGSWTIDGVKPGSYTVKELAKEGWTCSDPGNPCQRDATVVSDADTAIAAFGNYRDATISGHKFADLDQNHQKGAGEPYLAGWTIYVDTNGNGALDDGEPSAVTDAGGAYSIGGLTPSDTPVQVREVQQPGWACTAPTTVDDHGCLYTLTLHSGDAKTADFGNFRSIGVTLDKTGPDLAHHGDTLNYLIKVSTQSEAPLSVVTVTDPKCADAPVLTGKTGGNGDALLEQGETWTYACSLTLPATHAAGDSPFVNTAFVDAQDELGRDVTSQDDQATRILHPAISLDKQVRLGTEGAYTDGPLEAYVGDLLGYRVAVTNAGDTALTLAWGADASSAAFVDDRCDPGTISGPLGDDGDGKLGVGETWSYTCTHRITAADPDPLTNTVKVTGTDQLGGPKGTVTDTDSTTTDIVHPAIAIDKTGPATATAGALITYTLDVTNPGDMSFADPLVVVADALCQAPPALQTKNGDGSPGTLDPGDRWTYTCQVQTQSGQTSVHNVGDVTGTDHNGHSVNATDDATTVLAQQAVSPVAVVSPGSAKLRGPVGCPTTRLVKASVTGKRIVRVTWYVDGRKVATRTKPDKKGRWTISLRLRSLRYGVHTVRAQVRFAADSQTKTKTMRLSFTRCRPAIVRPKFTG